MNSSQKILLFSIITILIVLPGCKKNTEFNLSGTWNITATILGQDYQDSIILSGSESSGTGTHSIFGEVGSYQIDGSDVSFTGQFQADSYTMIVTGAGVIDDENNMSGSFTFYNADFPDYKMSGTWTATKS